LQIENGEIKLIKINFPERVAAVDVKELDNDGYSEVIGFDTHWEFYKGISHAGTPDVEIVARWRDGAYSIASNEFPQFYDDKISEIEANLDNPDDEESYFSNLLSLLLNHIIKGEKEKGFTEFKKYANSYEFKTPKLKAEISRIKKDLDKWIKEEGVNELLGKSNKTADWQIYKNNKYGFEIKYPKGFSLLESDTSKIYQPYNNKVVEINKILCCKGGGFDDGMSVSIFYSKDENKYPVINNLLSEERKISSKESFSVEKYTYGDFEGIKKVSKTKEKPEVYKEEHLKLFLKTNIGFYEFLWDSMDPQNKGFTFDNYFIPMLSTFKFIK